MEIDDARPPALLLTRWATSSLFLVFGITLACWAPMVPYVKADLMLSESYLGLILLAFGIGALLLMPVTGWLVHRFGSRLVVSLGGPAMIALLPLLTLAPNALSLGILLFCFGGLSGVMNVAVNSHAVAVEKLWPTPIMSRFHSLFSFGGLLGAASMTIFLEMGYSLFIAACTTTLPLFFVTLWASSKHLPETEVHESSAKGGYELLPYAKIFFLGMLCFTLFLAEGAMLDWSALFLRSVRGYDAASAGIGYALFAIAMSFGRFFGDVVVAQLGPSRTIGLGSAMTALGFFVCIAAPQADLMGFLLIGLGAANIVPTAFSATGQLAPQASGIALTIVTTMGYTGMVLGPALIGFIAEATSLSFSFVCLGLGLVAVSLSTVGWQPPTRQAIAE